MLKRAVLGVLLVASAFSVTSQTGSPCLAKCQRKLKEEIAKCDKMYKSTESTDFHDAVQHEACVANARKNFERCMPNCNPCGPPGNKEGLPVCQ